MRIRSQVVLLLMACLLAACATSKRNSGNSATALGADMNKAVELAESTRIDGTANPNGAGTADLTPAESMTSARFQRVAEGIRDTEQALVWADHDNGGDINWSDARQHCAARGAGWSLPSVAALRSLFDPTGTNPRTVTVHEKMYTILVVTPMISLSSLFFWSSEELGASEASYVDFVNGTDAAGTMVSTYARALCVWRSQ